MTKITEVAQSPEHRTREEAKEFLLEIYSDIVSRAPECEFFYSGKGKRYKLYRTVDESDFEFIDKLKTIKTCQWKIIKSTKDGIHPISELLKTEV